MESQLKGIKIAVLGGDERELEMLRLLATTGVQIKTLGDPGVKIPGIEVKDRLSTVIDNVDVVIAPMTSTDEDDYLKATFVNKAVQLTEEFFAELKSETLFIIGVARGSINDYCSEYDISLIQLAKLDEVAILNAIPTAEGAIQIAMEESDITLHSNKSMVLGLGRVGLTQARMLAGLGSQVYGVARDAGDRARAKEMGITPVDFDELKEIISAIDFIFNTVPTLILDRELLTEVKADVLIIDLASAPGGVDFEVAKELGIKALLSLGLPGKVAPKTAGQILGEVIPRLIVDRM